MSTSQKLPSPARLAYIRRVMYRLWSAENELNDVERSSAMQGATMRAFDYWRTLFYRDLTLAHLL